MNESAADVDSPSSDSESCPKLSKPPTRYNSAQANPYSSRPLSVKKSDKSKSDSMRLRFEFTQICLQVDRII